MSINIVILAAGQSVRMNSSIPKVMHKIAEVPALSYVLETSKQAKPDKIILVTSPNMDKVREFADNLHQGIIHAIQTKPLGTGDAVKSALPFLDQDGITIIIYGDSPFITTESLNKLKQQPNDISLLGFNTNNPNKYGRLIIDGDNLLKIIEFNDANDEEKLITYCNSGIYSVKNNILHQLVNLIKDDNAKHEFYLTDIIKLATMRNITCKAIEVDEMEVIAFNTRAELAIAQEVMQKRIKDRLMDQGVTIISPETSYIAYDFKAGQDITIYPNVFIGSQVSLGDEVVIRSFSHLEGVEVADQVIIGPFARIRPNSKIAQKAKIGNFVEIKNSNIDYEAKINHLSYIGDSEIGYKTNVGAGSITCNYDGISTKSKTKIGNEVSIGSNSCLIAPINIANRAFIAAGSVITKDVAEDDLAFGRAKQINLNNQAKTLRDKSANNNDQ